MKVAGVTVPMPLKQPYQELYVAKADDEVVRIEFISNRPTRLAMPANYIVVPPVLEPFSIKTVQNTGGIGRIFGSNYTDISSWNYNDFTLATILINSGTSVGINSVATEYGCDMSVIRGSRVRATVADYFKFVHDKVNHKYSCEFTLNNDLEETDPTVLSDDTQTAFWTALKQVAGSYDITLSDDAGTKAKGTNSLKMTIGAGAFAQLGVIHDYGGSTQDWSDEKFICFYWYGDNSGATWDLYIYQGGDYRKYSFVDNWDGFKRLVLPLNNPTGTSASSPDLSAVNIIQFLVTADANTTITYIDRVLLDTSQWVKVEAFAPDVLSVTGSDYESNGHQIKFWDGAAYTNGFAWNNSDGTISALGLGTSQFLDGTEGKEIDGTTWGTDIITGYADGLKGETKNGALGSITYSAYYGTMKRIGFGIKIPPDDGQDSATAGISQCRLKLEVYYDDSVNLPTVAHDFSHVTGDATVYGATRVAGQSGYGLSLNGTSDYVQIPSYFNTKPITFSVWAYFGGAVAGYRTLFSNWNLEALTYKGIWVLIADNDDTIYVQSATSSGAPGNWVGGTLNVGWNLITITIAADDTVIIYIGDTPTNITANTNGYASYTTTPLRLGKSYISNYYNDQDIDNFRVWNRVLTQAEVTALLNGTPVYDGLIADYTFDEERFYGQTTYEFEDGNNHYYGLDNLTSNWLALFDATNKVVRYFIIDKAPTGLKVCADENELIHWIEYTLPAGTRLYGGEMYRADVATDSDGDGVPDFLEEM